jgi:hypothetical protein
MSIQTFTTVGNHTFIVSQDGYYDILLVGGGGGGGASNGCGGGGGDVIEKLNHRLNAGTYTITVGDGGNGGYDGRNGANSSNHTGNNGFTSSITSSVTGFVPLYAAGGGGGVSVYSKNHTTTPTAGSTETNNFSSGGGGGGERSGGSGNGVSGNGGSIAGGGGGAAEGGHGSGNLRTIGSVTGGLGVTSSISGQAISYGGGGGGAYFSNFGRDGGGNGGKWDNKNGNPGATNRGGGGGGGNAWGDGGKGGSGIVIIKLIQLVPTNCSISDWSQCTNNQRTRSVTQATNGGTACTSDQNVTEQYCNNCSGNYSNWIDNSNNPVCPLSTNYAIPDISFNIKRNRTRIFNISQNAFNGGTCPETDISTNTNEIYDFKCPRDCSGNYSNWIDNTNNPVCPSSTNYSILDISFNIKRNRTRTFNISKNALNNGTCPQTDISNTSEIYDFKCPRNCLGGPTISNTSYSTWSNWSNPCPNTNDYNAPDTSFNNITQSRTRTYIKTKNQLNGGSCNQEEDIYTKNTRTITCPRDCSGGPVSSDASYSAWGNWSNPCPNIDDYNAPDTSFNITQNRTRTYIKTKNQLNGGSCNQEEDIYTKNTRTISCPRDCSGGPVSSDASYSVWGIWSNPCPNTNDYNAPDTSFNITQNRTRTYIKTKNQLNQGLCNQEAEIYTKDTRTITCPRNCLGGPTTSDASYSAWGNWSNPCPNTNDYNAPDTSFNITQSRSRIYKKTKNQLNGGSCNQEAEIYTKDTRTITCPRNCLGGPTTSDTSYTTWSNWGDWSNPCPNTNDYNAPDTSFNITQSRTRTYIKTKNQLNGGLCNQEEDIYTKDTRTILCPRDCSGNWSDWSDCNANNISTRTYRIINPAINNGLACPSQLLESDNCNVDCSGNWSDWSACNADNISTRTYRIINSAKNNGLACPSQLLETKTCGNINVFSVIVSFIKLIFSFILSIFKK